MTANMLHVRRLIAVFEAFPTDIKTNIRYGIILGCSFFRCWFFCFYFWFTRSLSSHPWRSEQNTGWKPELLWSAVKRVCCVRCSHRNPVMLFRAFAHAQLHTCISDHHHIVLCGAWSANIASVCCICVCYLLMLEWHCVQCWIKAKQTSFTTHSHHQIPPAR